MSHFDFISKPILVLILILIPTLNQTRENLIEETMVKYDHANIYSQKEKKKKKRAFILLGNY